MTNGPNTLNNGAFFLWNEGQGIWL